MAQTNVKRLVFSSTAAVYGTPEVVPIPEDSPFAPVSPYGESKVMVETMLGWFDKIHALRSISLRYFNAAGADPQGRLGEEHDPETHLIPLLFRAIRTGEPITVFGEDYATPDGTCIRDYIHVSDLAEAHILAVEKLLAEAKTDAMNVGTGSGHSVREVIRAVEDVTGKKVPFVMGPRREGDPPVLVADSAKLRGALGWQPRHSDLREIVSTAWQFDQRPGR
jgi:UDP-glucose-4-epimerase GalE